jgi:two-component system chemotaxis response regulator CheB
MNGSHRVRRAIVIGASAGGVEALRAVMGGLSPDLPAPVVVVLHIPRDSPSALAGILDRAGPLPAVVAEHGRLLRGGVVYVAPADHHVLLADGHLRLSTGPTENGHRPAIDPLFRSAALAYGPGAVGVVLSGTRDDGAAGLATIASRGGITVVQDPEDALYGAMPANALAQVPDALVHPSGKLGAVLGELVAVPLPTVLEAPGAAEPATAPDLPTPQEPAAAPELLDAETAIAAAGAPTLDQVPEASPSPFSCPSCHGVLFELPGSPAPRFRCRVGHAWSPASLEDEQSRSVDQALWAAVRALEEKASLVERLADEARRHGRPHSAANYTGRSAVARAQAEAVRTLVQGEGESGRAPAS